LLMWDMRRRIDTDPMPPRRSVIQFIYPEQSAAQRNWWLIVVPGANVDLCHIDPGFDVDLYVSTELRTMTEIWMGLKTVSHAVDDGKLTMTGLGGMSQCNSFALRESMVQLVSAAF
jgi:hypothetical protein